MITSAVLAAADGGNGFTWRTLLIFVGAAILLAFFSSLGILARIRERRIEDRREAERVRVQRQRMASDGSGDIEGPAGG